MPDVDDDIIRVPRRRHKHKPVESAWRQQRLPAYRPVLDARCAWPLTLVIGVVFCAIGSLLLVAYAKSKEEVIDYTECRSSDGIHIGSTLNTSAPNAPNITCMYNIELKTNFTGNVRFFYGLAGFYQNLRLYVKSRNDEQLFGDLNKTDDCAPLDRRDVGGGRLLPIVPCGQIADSMFNDTFSLSLNGRLVPLTAAGILQEFTRKRKFRNPQNYTSDLCDAFANTVRPPSWRRDICTLGVPLTESEGSVGRGFENIDFIVWMSPAALPSFRKIYRRLDTEADDFKNGLPAGNYTLIINYNYPVASWSGRKFFVITADAWLPSLTAGRGLFLAVSFLVVGVFLLLVTALFVGICIKQRFCSAHPSAFVSSAHRDVSSAHRDVSSAHSSGPAPPDVMPPRPNGEHED